MFCVAWGGAELAVWLFRSSGHDGFWCLVASRVYRGILLCSIGRILWVHRQADSLFATVNRSTMVVILPRAMLISICPAHAAGNNNAGGAQRMV